MSYSMRTTLVIGACAVAVATAGCGGVASVATSSVTPSSAVPTTSTSASPQACANPTLTSGTSPVTQLALTVTDLPPGGPAVEQISDGEMSNTVNTDQRGFANVANTFRIEDDVVLDTSPQAASADYPQLQTTTGALFTTLKDSIIAVSTRLPGRGVRRHHVNRVQPGWSRVSGWRCDLGDPGRQLCGDRRPGIRGCDCHGPGSEDRRCSELILSRFSRAAPATRAGSLRSHPR